MGVSFIAMIIAVGSILYLQDTEAKQAGFLNASDRRLAKEFGYTSAEAWNQNRKAVLAEHKAGIDAQVRLDQGEEDTNTDVTAVTNPEDKVSAQAITKTEATNDIVTTQETSTPVTSAKQSKRYKKNNRMTKDVIAALKHHTDIEPEPVILNKPFCREDGYCTFMADEFRIQIYGNGIASILTSTQASHSKYRDMCAIMLSGLSGANITFAQEAIAGAFIHAAQTGKFQQDLNSVQIIISPDINNILACEFFKYGK